MSKVAIEGNASGTGTLTIAAPNTNSNFTLSLPTNTGTIITQNSTPAFASTIGVGGATAAASGAGITFPATQSASSDANTLDDYEEGTWSPELLSDGGSAAGKTYTTQLGRYTKIGNVVYFQFVVQFSNKGSNNVNEAYLDGFPFAVSSTNGGRMHAFIEGWGNVGVNSITFALTFRDATSARFRTTTGATASPSLYFSSSYTDTTFFVGGGFYHT
jgi:hypothetical protein